MPLAFPVSQFGVRRPNAVTFDGTNDYLSQSVPGSQGNQYRAMFSFWINAPTQASYGIDRIISFGSIVDFAMVSQPGIGLAIQAQNNSSTSNLRVALTAYEYFNVDLIVQASGAYNIPRNTTTHVYCVCDTENFIYRIFYNGVEDGSFADVAAYGIAIQAATGAGSNAIGRWNNSTPSSQYLRASVSELWADLNYYDPDIYASQFYNGGTPPSHGANGANIAGAKPSIYMQQRAADYATNSGSSGNFTLTGALVDTIL
jgi:hypothetical protein